MAQTVLVIFTVIALGYLLGSIKIKGVGLGPAGVLICALVCGLAANAGLFPALAGEQAKQSFSLLSSMGTAMFITAVGLTAGPGFFRGLGRHSLPGIFIGIIIVGCGVLICCAITLLDPTVDASLGLGLMTGAMTSTPGFSSAMDSPLLDSRTLAAGYGIAYLFGILGKVLFMQLLPKALGASMEQERRLFIAGRSTEQPQDTEGLKKPDSKGFCAFALSAALGLALGQLHIPGVNFSLGSSGGTLVCGILIGHLGHIGKLDLRIPKASLAFFRELGLVLFLVGAGIPGGINFAEHLRPVYFLYGAAMTLLPMFIGFLLARRLFRMGLLNALGSIAGGLTSTPALGALISACGTDAVVSVYAAAYPVALVCMVFATKLLPFIL